MSPATTYGVYHVREARIESIHAFRYLAEQHVNALIDAQEFLNWEDFAIGTMEQCIDWLVSDAKNTVLCQEIQLGAC